MIQVAHLLPTLEIGGKERTVIDLCARAAAHGQEAIIVTYDPPQPGRALLDSGATECVRLDRKDAGFAESLQALLATRSIDVLHAHGQVAAIYAAAIDGPPPARITTLHTALGEGWKWLPQIVLALRRMDAVTAVSEDVAARFRRFGVRDIEIVPTAVDTEAFAPPATRPSEDRFVVGMAGRLHPVKRHKDAIAACAIARRAGVEIDLGIAGDGPLDAALRRMAPDAAFLGAQDDMPGFYRSLDAFLICSDHEAMPLALLEAMASGLPCIATRTGGMTPMIESGAMLGVPRRDPNAIAAAIAGLASDPDLRRNLGARARSLAEGFGADRQAGAYAELYRKITEVRG